MSEGPSPSQRPLMVLREFDDSTVRTIQRFCNYIASAIGESSLSVRLVDGVMRPETVSAYRKVLGLFARVTSDRMTYLPSRDPVWCSRSVWGSLSSPSAYTTYGGVRGGYACRTNKQALDFFRAAMNSGREPASHILPCLEESYETMSDAGWSNNPVPNLELTESELARLVPDKEIVLG